MNLNRISYTAACAFTLIMGIAARSLPIEARDKVLASEPAPEFSDVYVPRVPDAVTFAGKKVDLTTVDMAERLDRELTAMCYGHGNTLLAIKRANRYFPQIVPILKQKGVPEDIVYLAAIESTMNPRAVSSARAAGLWQFMPSTAKEYGLEVNDEVDERYDVEKSTRAACDYLKRAYAKYGNWESVAASYNGGMGRISGELAAQNADSAYDLWLAEETMRYIFRLLSMKMIMEDPSKYGYRLRPDDLYQPFDYTEVTVSGPVADWPDWAAEHGTDYRTLREHNPWIRAKKLTNKAGKTYTVRIPDKKSESRSRRHVKVYNHAWVSGH